MVQVLHFAEFVKRVAFFLEKLVHQVRLAAVKTIRNMALVLPNGAHSFLHVERVGKFTYLLELVNANDDMATLPLGNHFWKAKQFFWRVRFGRDAQRYRVF